MRKRVVALSGGIGGAKLALGLASVLGPGDLVVAANTGDDFEHLGFLVCPDIDTLVYTLGGVANPQTGWGRADETWSFMERLETEDPEHAWFRLGDKDLEVHRFRKAALSSGKSLGEVTALIARRFGVDVPVIPMSEDPVRTHLLAETGTGPEWLPFQEYFVRHGCEPVVRRIEFRGREQASVTPGLAAALAGGDTRAVVICPSNPYLSIDPILAVPGMTEAISGCGAPVVAVSPIVGGRALKGPTTKIMAELGLAADVAAIAEHYAGLVDGLVIDRQDGEWSGPLRERGMRVSVTNTVMTTLEDRRQLAREVLDFANRLTATHNGDGYVGRRTS